jgi:fructose/tagatose bisphosphate aldolase
VTFLHHLSSLLAGHRRRPIFLKINHVPSPDRRQRECQRRFQSKMRDISTEINNSEAMRFD